MSEKLGGRDRLGWSDGRLAGSDGSVVNDGPGSDRPGGHDGPVVSEKLGGRDGLGWSDGRLAGSDGSVVNDGPGWNDGQVESDEPVVNDGPGGSDGLDESGW